MSVDEMTAWAAERPQDFAPGFLKCLEFFPFNTPR